MRVRKTNDYLAVGCVAGSYVTLIGWPYPKINGRLDHDIN